MLIVIMLMSYDTNAQVHWTVDLWEIHGGYFVYVGIQGRLSGIFHIFFCTYVLHVYYTIMN